MEASVIWLESKAKSRGLCIYLDDDYTFNLEEGDNLAIKNVQRALQGWRRTESEGTQCSGTPRARACSLGRAITYHGPKRPHPDSSLKS